MKQEFSIERSVFVRLAEAEFEIPTSYNPFMRVPARIIATEKLLRAILKDRSIEQIVNVTTLPGIVTAAYAMPDMHQGYGFPIGGVAATDYAQGGVVSPGGIGYDINCGVRLLRTNIQLHGGWTQQEKMADVLTAAVPSGVGRGGSYTLSQEQFTALLNHGPRVLLAMGIGEPEDIEACEATGFLPGADAAAVSERAQLRGFSHLGTLGSGNHFLEVQRIAEIYDTPVAESFGLHKGMLTVMIHCGSRGLGHQICTDYVQEMVKKLPFWDIKLPDRELACAPLNSSEGEAYCAAMNSAAHFAWGNRHAITHSVRRALTDLFGPSTEVTTIYDVCHNIGKREQHQINGEMRELFVHRKGATRAFGANHPALPARYRPYGHPVIIPGTMGTASYVLVGAPYGSEAAWGSTCHGAGRAMSRTHAYGKIKGKVLREELEDKGISIRCRSDQELAEEAPAAYKDIDSVIDAVNLAGIARPIARMVPLAVIKG